MHNHHHTLFSFLDEKQKLSPSLILSYCHSNGNGSIDNNYSIGSKVDSSKSQISSRFPELTDANIVDLTGDQQISLIELCNKYLNYGVFIDR